MKYHNIFGLLFLSITLFLGGCKKPKSDEILIEIDNLRPLQNSFYYSIWLMSGNDNTKAGSFQVNTNGSLTSNKFNLDPTIIKSASSVGCSIEANQSVTSPSSTFMLAGTFDGAEAVLTVADNSALNNNFSSAEGIYITATVTNAVGTTHEYSGIWWVTDINGTAPGLTIPTLPNGFIYEAWIKINDTYVSTGRFSQASGPDMLSLYGDTLNPSFNYPGEDLLQNAPAGLTFPINLKFKELFVSVEYIDNVRDQPFLTVLYTSIPGDADFNAPYAMDNVSDYLPTITVKRRK
ncbi:hypothetical protein K6119_13255 [Paracrocinitomix mangrovi]|uniref:hypothetical protein n=1 Tax=Paracrocinitomix mangrovi TaxID=2862509 RepID=UPI001C8E0E21|nr:hypothetical protein [Paracrocinitomix mangrovi]UKN00698.1 hypothetical protein K6119_13255 [Paracrocinitomix mangrovi]